MRNHQVASYEIMTEFSNLQSILAGAGTDHCIFFRQNPQLHESGFTQPALFS
jgi:hypothetical protein